MGQHKINDNGHFRWFDTDEDYYAYIRVRRQFDSAEEYDNARADFKSDTELLSYLERKGDDGYQHWLIINRKTRYDSEETYQEYLMRSNDEIYQSWILLHHELSYPDDYDKWYKEYLDEKAKYGSDENFKDYLKKEIEQRDERERVEYDQHVEQRKQKAKILINAGFGILAAIILIFGIKWHWSIVIILILMVILLVGCILVTKKVLDNIY